MIAVIVFGREIIMKELNKHAYWGLYRKLLELKKENSNLKSQLMWKPVSEKPKKNGWILYKCWINENRIETYDETSPYFLGTQEAWVDFVHRCDVIAWMYVPLMKKGVTNETE
jgi:hypothetical protein